MADGLVVPIVLAAAWAFLFRVPKERRLEIYSWALIIGLITYTLAKLIAAVWQPDVMRPFEQTGASAGAFYLQNAGFPSDHALFCAFLTLAVYFLTSQTKLAIVMGVLTVLVCVGRVLALVHTPLDVIGGVSIACLGALCYIQYNTAQAKNHSSNNRKNIVK